MKKRIFSAVLCLSMVAIMLMVSVVATSAQTVSSIANNSGLSILTYNSGTGAYIFFGNVTENATVTLFFMPGADYTTDQDGFSFDLINADLKTVTGFGTNIFGGNGSTLFLEDGSRGTNWTGWNGASAVALNIEEWNRLDLVVDFENQQVTGYVNYTSVGTLGFNAEATADGDVTSFVGIRMNGKRGGYRPYNRSYVDNLVVTSGLNAPTDSDFISNLTPESCSDNADKVLHVETFEPGTEIKTGVDTPSTMNKGEIWNARTDGNTGFCSIGTIGIVPVYTVTWVIGDTTTTESVAQGTVPTAPTNTDKESTAQYDYTFTGWDKEIVAATEDVTYTAQYSTSIKKYNVSWNIDGVITTQSVAYGTVPTAPTNTAKAPNAQYTYTFIGWNKSIVAVTEDVTYTAQYSRTVNLYKVNWDIDGTVISQNVAYGTVPTAPENTDKAADALYIYTFTGWDKEIVAVTGNVTYVAQYEKTANMASVNDKIDALYDSIAEIKAKLEQADTDNKAELQAKIDALENALADAKTELEQADTDNKAELQAKIDAVDTALKQLQADFNSTKTELEDKIDDLGDALAAAKDALAKSDADNKTALQAEIDAIEKALADAKTALEQADTDNKAELQAKIDAVDTALKQLQASLNSTKTELESEIEAIEKALADAKTALEKALADNKTEQQAKIDALQATIDELNGKLDAAKEALDKATANNDEMEQKFNDALAQNKKDCLLMILGTAIGLTVLFFGAIFIIIHKKNNSSED